jgi:hypothetical protein
MRVEAAPVEGSAIPRAVRELAGEWLPDSPRLAREMNERGSRSQRIVRAVCTVAPASLPSDLRYGQRGSGQAFRQRGAFWCLNPREKNGNCGLLLVALPPYNPRHCRSFNLVRAISVHDWKSWCPRFERSWRHGDRPHLRLQDRRCGEGSGHLQRDAMPVPPTPLEQAAAQRRPVRTGADQPSPFLLQP